ncbi:MULTISPECIES: hypothetical protein [unclassified Lactococcus]|uniref:hypothetical protein n=1 Tax=unclassified Lactococcus TaxID=2643510 RepID=UPI001E2B3B9F|nr:MULTISPECIES: hypothetical protein [unclassified Lactococcus]
MNKIVLSGITMLTAGIILTGCSTDTSTTKTNESSKTEQVDTSKKLISSGEVIGNFNSEADEVVGATKPGDYVEFYVPVHNDSEYLHFAFMHAGSGDKGWYFAPVSDDGIKLTKSDIEKGDINITDQIGLFMAPNASTSEQVTKDDGKLKNGAADKFLDATVTLTDDVYKVKIKNISSGDYETAFSSGVWGIADVKTVTFDHQASSGLTKLATMGHRDELYKSAVSQEE